MSTGHFVRICFVENKLNCGVLITPLLELHVMYRIHRFVNSCFYSVPHLFTLLMSAHFTWLVGGGGSLFGSSGYTADRALFSTSSVLSRIYIFTIYCLRYVV